MLKPIEADCLKSLDKIRHGFYTRNGGLSQGLYKELNCGFGSNDPPAIIRANRSKVAKHLYPQADDVVTVYQIHSARAIKIHSPPNPEDLPKADAIITTTPGLVIGVLTADCTPVLFCDADKGVIAAAHAGWRGAQSGILEATVEMMISTGARRENIKAAIGPCISQKNYEVGFDFQNKLLSADATKVDFFTQPQGADKPHFDLPGYVAARLRRLKLGNVQNCFQCTYENDSLFYSFRRTQHRHEPDFGRQISAIVLV